MTSDSGVQPVIAERKTTISTIKSSQTLPIKTSFSGDFFDADYFENGRLTGKSWLLNYRWMPQRSFREALAIIDYLRLDDKSKVLDFGCAKGFLVRALRELEIDTDGCDISNYALSFAPEGCWNVEEDWNRKYTHIICKDVLEHLTPEFLGETLERLKTIGDKFMCIVPMGDFGKYRIPEYHSDVSHIIAENEDWWEEKFEKHGWKVLKEANHVLGIKDNWSHHEFGNHVYVLGRV